MFRLLKQIERNKNESLYSMNKTHQTEYLYEDNKKSKKDLKSNQTISNDKTKVKDNTKVKSNKKSDLSLFIILL